MYILYIDFYFFANFKSLKVDQPRIRLPPTSFASHICSRRKNHSTKGGVYDSYEKLALPIICHVEAFSLDDWSR